MVDQHVRVGFLRRHPLWSAAAATAAAWWLWQGWYGALALTVAIGVLVITRRRRREALLRDAGLLARADFEHRLSLAGDPAGVFGRYRPAAPDWYPDPHNPLVMRYFDGLAWTSHVLARHPALPVRSAAARPPRRGS